MIDTAVQTGMIDTAVQTGMIDNAVQTGMMCQETVQLGEGLTPCQLGHLLHWM